MLKVINDTICLQEFASLKSSESASTLYDDVQSIGSKSKVWHVWQKLEPNWKLIVITRYQLKANINKY